MPFTNIKKIFVFFDIVDRQNQGTILIVTERGEVENRSYYKHYH